VRRESTNSQSPGPGGAKARVAALAGDDRRVHTVEPLKKGEVDLDSACAAVGELAVAVTVPLPAS
jgi:hypothetical protein